MMGVMDPWLPIAREIYSYALPWSVNCAMALCPKNNGQEVSRGAAG